MQEVLEGLIWRCQVQRFCALLGHVAIQHDVVEPHVASARNSCLREPRILDASGAVSAPADQVAMLPG